MNWTTPSNWANDNNYTRSVWRISWNLRHCTKPWEKGIEPQCHKYETDGWFKYHTSVNMNFKSFHMYRLENKNPQCFLHPLVPFFWSSFARRDKKSVWDCWARGCEVEQKKWHWFFGSADTTVSGRVVLVLNLNVRKKEKKEDGSRKWANTGATAFHLGHKSTVLSENNNCHLFHWYFYCFVSPKIYINWEWIQFNIWEGSEREGAFGKNKFK